MVICRKYFSLTFKTKIVNCILVLQAIGTKFYFFCELLNNAMWRTDKFKQFCNLFTSMCCLCLCMRKFVQLYKVKFRHPPIHVCLFVLYFLSCMLCVSLFTNCIVFPGMIIFHVTIAILWLSSWAAIICFEKTWKDGEVLDLLQCC